MAHLYRAGEGKEQSKVVASAEPDAHIVRTGRDVIMHSHGRSAMPTVLRNGPYRVFFYSSDRDEPPHVHVQRESMVAKLWLNPVRLAGSGGFRALELRRVQALVEDHREMLLERWHEFFAR